MWYVGRDARNVPSYLGSGTYLKRAIKKYGKENFIKQIIETLPEGSTIEDLKKKETEWLSRLDAAKCNESYNIKSTGDPGISSCEWTEEMRKNNAKKAHEWRINNPSLFEEAKKKQKNLAGLKENRIKNSLSQGSRPFEVFDKKTMKKIAEYLILKECEKDLGIDRRVISQYLKGRRNQLHKRSCHPYFFKYKE